MTKNDFDHFDLDHFDTRTPASLEIDTRLSVIFTATTATNCNKADFQHVAFNSSATVAVAVEKTRRENGCSCGVFQNCPCPTVPRRDGWDRWDSLRSINKLLT
jgi:hypothetical protein